MTRDEIHRRLKPLFHDVFDDDTIDPHDHMTAADVDNWDSLTNIRLIVAVEEEFGVQFTTAEISFLENVGTFVSLIQRKATA